MRSFGAEPEIMAMLPDRCVRLAEQLLGPGTFVDPRQPSPPPAEGEEPPAGRRCRGVYCTLPEAAGTQRVAAALQENFENDLEPVHWDST